MSNYLQTITKESKPYYKTLLDDINSRKDKDFFRPTGVQVYIGMQGQGKTASAVFHALKLKKRYPKSILVTNLSLTGLTPLAFGSKEELVRMLRHIDPAKQYISFQSVDELAIALTTVNNGKFGVLYLIDEIHTYFNALDSKNIPPYVFAEIAQQRKQRKCIVATSQLFPRIAKPFREQVDNVIDCTTIFGVLTLQKAYDGATLDQDYNGKYRHTGIKRRGWFIQTRELRDAYDTYQKITPGETGYNVEKPTQIGVSLLPNKRFK